MQYKKGVVYSYPGIEFVLSGLAICGLDEGRGKGPGMKENESMDEMYTQPMPFPRETDFSFDCCDAS